ncbi:MAG TPA: peptidoglycan-associated lipoprotein Pal [Methylophilaceae bacterium]|nr:peptidoglycan-associated lipoprotein Pal [Methylophilaceae bacterium]
MNKRLIGSVLLTMLLVSCASKPVKEPAKVEDKSPTTQPAPAADDSAATKGVTDSSMDGKSNMSPLKDPNNILSKRSIYFDFDSDEVKAEYRPLVEAHAKYLQANASTNLVLQGNADERGTREYNLSLGQRRSVAVKKVMNLLGAQDKQIETVSYGEEKANTSCQDDTCYKQDRHVEIVYQGE